MRFSVDLSPQDRLHWQADGLALGTVALPAEAEDFGRERALAHHHLVWPRTQMRIHMQGFAVPLHASPMAVTLHSPGFAYRRTALGTQGDVSDYLMLAPEWVEELQRGRAPAARFGRLHFGAAQRPVTAAQYLRVQTLRRLGGLAAQEEALALAAELLAPDAPALQAAPAAVARALALLAQGAGEVAARPLGLRELARRAAVSPFHLTRLFRRHTGLAMHQYAMALRARQALLALDAQLPLAELAQRLGYQDGAHLTRRFRQAFGLTPSQVRAGVRSPAPARSG